MTTNLLISGILLKTWSPIDVSLGVGKFSDRIAQPSTRRCGDAYSMTFVNQEGQITNPICVRICDVRNGENRSRRLEIMRAPLLLRFVGSLLAWPNVASVGPMHFFNGRERAKIALIETSFPRTITTYWSIGANGVSLSFFFRSHRELLSPKAVAARRPWRTTATASEATALFAAGAGDGIRVHRAVAAVVVVSVDPQEGQQGIPVQSEPIRIDCRGCDGGRGRDGRQAR